MAAATATTMIEQDELGPLYDFGSLYEDDTYQTITHRFAYGEDVSVMLTYAQEQPGDLQTGCFVSPAAPALCEYLEKHRDEIPHGTIVELGAGCGLTGLAIAQLQPAATVVFTDHDPGVLKTIDHNCTQQERKQATCITQRLRWGPDGAKEIEELHAQLATATPPQAVDMIVCSDVIYARECVAPLFWTVDQLLKKTSGGVFLMCSSYRYDDATEAEIDTECERVGLARKILSCTFSDTKGGCRVQRFTRKE